MPEHSSGLPAAVALSDALANPTPPPVGAHVLAWNGANWVRVSAAGLTDGVSGGGFNFVRMAASLFAYNGATQDRIRSVSGVGEGQGVVQAMAPSSTAPAAAAPAANTAATVTFAAVAGQSHRLTFLVVSYSGAPTGGRLTVADGATTIIDIDVTAAGPFVVPLPNGGIKGTVATAMTITLAAGGAGVAGKVSAAKITG
jgi:hypothetical protein